MPTTARVTAAPPSRAAASEPTTALSMPITALMMPTTAPCSLAALPLLALYADTGHHGRQLHLPAIEDLLHPVGSEWSLSSRGEVRKIVWSESTTNLPPAADPTPLLRKSR